MFIINGIAFANDTEAPITVISVRAMDDYKLWIRFSTNEVKVFDFTPFLEKGVFTKLKNKEIFESVYVDYGVPVWCNGEIDIAPELLYYDSVNI